MVFFFVHPHHQDWSTRLQDIAWICQVYLQQAQVPPPVPKSSVPILHGPAFSPASTQGPASCFRVRCHPASELSSYFRVRYYYTSSYFRVRDSLHPDLSPHINHISRTFSTQIITFPGFIPSKNTVSAFILQERSPIPAENTIFHICQKITYFDIFHLFCHFLRSTKITHFHKNTKNTYFHYFPLRWRKPKNHLFPQNTQNCQKCQICQKWGFPEKWPKSGKPGKWGKWADPPNTPKMPKMPKMGKLGILPIYPQNGYSAIATDEHTPQA